MHACKPTCKCKLLLKPVPKKTKSNESSEIVASEETEQRPEFDTSSSYDFTIKSRYRIKYEISTEGSISKGEHEQLPDLDVLLGDKLRMPSIVTKTEEYLRMHRINELVNYLMVKIISNTPEKPITFLVQLLDDCMLFRSGHTSAPIIYEKRFPVDPDAFERWTILMRQSRQETWWKPGKHSVICSDHFNSSDFYVTKCGLIRFYMRIVPLNALFLASTLSGNFPIDNIVIAEPITWNVEQTITTTDTRTPPLEDFFDIDSVFDTPRKTKLKKELYKQIKVFSSMCCKTV